ncbi:MAG: Sapep family Mn(2+)-dependent dipeptidase [Oscillospiraceae bacterium]
MAKDMTAFISENEQNIIKDIKRLIDIKSVKDIPAQGAPYGAGVRAVQLEAMKLCCELGLEVTDCDGKIAYAHYGNKDKFIGVIAHMDVVPEGGGWNSDPYCCTERDGYLVGRGVLDDKGPFVVAAYAIRYLIENKIKLNYGIRLIMGLDEETGMSDIEYYKENCALPIFTFTPDADFPVGHGEKGIYSSDLVSKAISGGNILELCGGVASNVVADYACAVIKQSEKDKLTDAAKGRNDVKVSVCDAGVKVEAFGRAAHAGQPHTGINANNILMAFLSGSGSLTSDEKSAAEFIALASGSFDGDQFGIEAEDGLFAPNSIIGGMLSMQDRSLVLNLNSRYNTKLKPEEIEKKIEQTAAKNGFSVANVENSGPFYMSPEHPAVKTMCDIYNEVTDSHEKPFVMSGGTYARHMDNAVSYGIEFPNQGKEDPEWVGGVHMKNEALKIERAKQACEIFINTFIKLQNIEF